MADLVPEPWNRETLPTLSATHLTYDFPSASNLDPFDVAQPHTQWLLEARGYSRAWRPPEMLPADYSRKDFFGINPADFERSVRPGYKYVRVLEKLAIVSDGHLVRSWASTSQPSFSSKDFPELQPFAVYLQRVRTLNPYDDGWYRDAKSDKSWADYAFMGDPLCFGSASYKQALLLALNMPPTMDTALMVARIVTHFSYH